MHEDESHMNYILTEVVQRRYSQIHAGWTPEHDAKHGISHLLALIEDYMFDASFLSDVDPGKSRDRLLDVIALGIAAVELMDRETEDA